MKSWVIYDTRFGSTAHRHRPSDPVLNFFNSIPPDALRGRRVAAFGTRYRMPRRVSGFAARGIAKRLRRKGATVLLSPESFFVGDREGSLHDGELQRAAGWARNLVERVERRDE